MINNGKLAMVLTLYAIATFFLGLILGHNNAVEHHSPKTSKHIKTEYFLEVSEDSIKVESQSGKVYTGKYADLDSLICIDNI